MLNQYRNISELAFQYRESKLVILKGFVTPQSAEKLEIATHALPKQRVICGDTSVSWDEQYIGSEHELYGFLNSPETCKLVERLTNLQIDQTRTLCWVSRYKDTEYIDKHQDFDGEAQLIVCLKSAPENCGGWLMIEQDGIEERYVMSLGDALLFSARTIAHYTTALAPTKQHPSPQRVVVVARYNGTL